MNGCENRERFASRLRTFGKTFSKQQFCYFPLRVLDAFIKYLLKFLFTILLNGLDKIYTIHNTFLLRLRFVIIIIVSHVITYGHFGIREVPALMCNEVSATPFFVLPETKERKKQLVNFRDKTRIIRENRIIQENKTYYLN